MEAWLYHGGGLELWNELYEPFNVIALPMGNSGVQMGGWFNKKIETIDDLKGLRMRIPGLGGKVLDRAGGNPILMSGGRALYRAGAGHDRCHGMGRPPARPASGPEPRGHLLLLSGLARTGSGAGAADQPGALGQPAG